jgi:hypothetical protein
MKDAFRAEWTKLCTMASTFWLLLAAAAPAVRYTLTIADTEVTAAHVLQLAATATAAQPDTRQNAPYWHTLSQLT